MANLSLTPTENFYHILPLTDSERTVTPHPPPALYLLDRWSETRGEQEVTGDWDLSWFQTSWEGKPSELLWNHYLTGWIVSVWEFCFILSFTNRIVVEEISMLHSIKTECTEIVFLNHYICICYSWMLLTVAKDTVSTWNTTEPQCCQSQTCHQRLRIGASVE